jgi:3-oxoacyl-[acyl-carrier-protein] synthase III
MTSILGFGCALPEQVVDHTELAAQLGVEPEWILEACGIRERRYARPDESVVDLAERAARTCLERLDFDPAQLGGILVGTGTSPKCFPGVSAGLQQRLGAGGLAFDVPLASSGGLIALCTASELCRHCGPMLVVGAEKMSEVVQRHPAKETTILFGDGAGACLVSPFEGPFEILDWAAFSDGTYAEDLCLEHGGPLVMNGRQVIMQAVRKLKASVQTLLERNSIAAAGVGLYLFHQANLNLLKQVAKGLGITEDHVFVNLETRGNTSAASLLIAAAEAQEQGRMRAGEHIVLAAFGAGFSYGAMLLKAR